MFDLNLLESQFLLFKYSSSHVTSRVHGLWVCVPSSHMRCLSILWVQLTPVSISRSHFLIKVNSSIETSHESYHGSFYDFLCDLLVQVPCASPLLPWIRNYLINVSKPSSWIKLWYWRIMRPEKQVPFWGRVSASDRSSIPILSFRLAPPISFCHLLKFQPKV